jgi:hypothetical protein
VGGRLKVVLVGKTSFAKVINVAQNSSSKLKGLFGDF